MSCPQCEDLMVPFEIRTPGELGKAVRVVQANLADGTLDQPASSSSTRPFLEVPEGGPWDDLLSYHFECRGCRQRFELSVETYHGAGGRWTPQASRG
jgi:hypothetical protein